MGSAAASADYPAGTGRRLANITVLSESTPATREGGQLPLSPLFSPPPVGRFPAPLEAKHRLLAYLDELVVTERRRFR